MKLKITKKKSTNKSLQVHKRTMEALGLRKIGSTVIKEDNPAIRGMIFRVQHLVEVEQIADQVEV